jgi:hypothetical protein
MTVPAMAPVPGLNDCVDTGLSVMEIDRLPSRGLGCGIDSDAAFATTSMEWTQRLMMLPAE